MMAAVVERTLNEIGLDLTSVDFCMTPPGPADVSVTIPTQSR